MYSDDKMWMTRVKILIDMVSICSCALLGRNKAEEASNASDFGKRVITVAPVVSAFVIPNIIMETVVDAVEKEVSTQNGKIVAKLLVGCITIFALAGMEHKLMETAAANSEHDAVLAAILLASTVVFTMLWVHFVKDKDGAHHDATSTPEKAGLAYAFPLACFAAFIGISVARAYAYKSMPADVRDKVEWTFIAILLAFLVVIPLKKKWFARSKVLKPKAT